MGSEKSSLMFFDADPEAIAVVAVSMSWVS
jgi:hypothetical protein